MTHRPVAHGLGHEHDAVRRRYADLATRRQEAQDRRSAGERTCDDLIAWTAFLAIVGFALAGLLHLLPQ